MSFESDSEFSLTDFPKTMIAICILTLIGCGVYVFYQQKVFSAASATTKATITNISDSYSRKLGLTTVIYTFQLDEVNYKSSQSAMLLERNRWKKKYHVKDMVNIWYDPENPGQNPILVKRYSLILKILAPAAIIGIIYGIFLEIRARKWQQEQYEKLGY